MSKNQTNKASNPAPKNAENPAGDVSLTEEDLDSVAGGDGTETLSCTGENTYCKGTCGIPWLTVGCCPGDET